LGNIKVNSNALPGYGGSPVYRIPSLGYGERNCDETMRLEEKIERTAVWKRRKVNEGSKRYWRARGAKKRAEKSIL